jgi:zinc protease
MLGYTVPTWYGYAGWGCLDYFVEQPGRFTFAEAFFANQHAMIHRLETCFPEVAREPLATPDDSRNSRTKITVSATGKALGLRAQDGAGLLFDRDALIFLGDPAWEARLAPGKLAYEQSLSEMDGHYIFTIKPLLGTKSFDTVNANGSQRGGRPFVAWFPERLRDMTLVSGAEFNPVLTDDFVLVPHPGTCDPEEDYKVAFKARPHRARDSEVNEVSAPLSPRP